MTRVMLIYPPFSQPVSAKKRCMVPLGIAYIAAYLREHNIEVSVLDCVVDGYEKDVVVENMRTFGLSDGDIENRIRDYGPHFVGVSCLMTQQRNNALRICELVKKVNPKIHTVMGGCHASVFPEEILKRSEVDSVVIGEGELSILRIIKEKKNGIIRSPHLDIDKIPWPARDLLDMKKYIKINMPENIYSPYNRVTQMLTSRGCPFHCVFCATTIFHGEWRGRDPEDVVREAKFLKEQYQIQELNIIDENFIVNRERTIKIMEGFAKLNIAWSNPGGIWAQGIDNYLLDLMKKAGCYQLTFAVESSNAIILKDVINKPLKIDKIKPLVKHCKQIGIDTHAFFVCGFPQQTREEIMNDFDFAMDVGFDSATFNIVSPLPGSKLYEQYKEQVSLDKINYTKVSIKHPTISDEELEEMIRSFNIRFNKSLLWRNPIKFIKKYIGTALRKYSIWELPKLFDRQ